MAVMMIMRWEGVTLDQYEEARSRIKWETDTPDGAMFHVAAHDGSAMRVTDVWESAEQFQRFGQERLMPVTKEIGIDREPEIEILEAHAIFAPAYEGANA